MATVTTLGASLQLTQHDDTLPVHNSRQRSAFPPNYVRTAMRSACDDCTWCHAMSWKVNASARPFPPKTMLCHVLSRHAVQRDATECHGTLGAPAQLRDRDRARLASPRTPRRSNPRAMTHTTVTASLAKWCHGGS